MAQENFEKDNVSNSKFYMLRCVIAMAHADGLVCDKEIAYISAIMNRLPLTKEQRTLLEDDFVTKQDATKLFTHINEPKYRAQVIYFARLMAYKDGKIDQSEQELLDQLHTLVTGGLNIEAIRNDVERAVKSEMLVHDISIDEKRPTKHGHFIPYFQWLDEILLHLGIDLMK